MSAACGKDRGGPAYAARYRQDAGKRPGPRVTQVPARVTPGHQQWRDRGHSITATCCLLTVLGGAVSPPTPFVKVFPFV